MNWRFWIHGLVGAIIGGASNAITAMVMDPKVFNFDDLGKLGRFALVSGIISAAMYLKQSPLPPDEEKPRISVPLSMLALIGCLLTGCAAIAPGNDSVVVNAERTTSIAVSTFDSFLKFEHENRERLKAVSPEIKVAADHIRRNGQGWLISARNLTKAYKYNRTPENQANLLTVISTLEQAIAESNSWLMKGTL